MYDTILRIFGEGRDLSILQMSLRSFIVFFICLALIRIAGRRSFATKTAFDNIVVILLGAILSRAVVGVSPFVPTIVSCFVLVVVYRSLAYLSLFFPALNRIMKGRAICLFENQKVKEGNMKLSSISHDDLLEGLRKEAHTESWEAIEKAYMETSGEITVVKKGTN